jgi:hypothetical protein
MLSVTNGLKIDPDQFMSLAGGFRTKRARTEAERFI